MQTEHCWWREDSDDQPEHNRVITLVLETCFPYCCDWKRDSFFPGWPHSQITPKSPNKGSLAGLLWCNLVLLNSSKAQAGLTKRKWWRAYSNFGKTFWWYLYCGFLKLGVADDIDDDDAADILGVIDLAFKANTSSSSLLTPSELGRGSFCPGAPRTMLTKALCEERERRGKGGD